MSKADFNTNEEFKYRPHMNYLRRSVRPARGRTVNLNPPAFGSDRRRNHLRRWIGLQAYRRVSWNGYSKPCSVPTVASAAPRNGVRSFCSASPGAFTATMLLATAAIAAPLFYSYGRCRIHSVADMGLCHPHRAAARPRQECLVAVGISHCAGSVQPLCRCRMACWKGRHGALFHSRADRSCALDPAICRNRPPARHGGTEQIRPQPACALLILIRSAAQRHKRKKPGGHQATGRIAEFES